MSNVFNDIISLQFMKGYECDSQLEFNLVNIVKKIYAWVWLKKVDITNIVILFPIVLKGFVVGVGGR